MNFQDQISRIVVLGMALVICGQSQAAILRVCNSGCAYTSIQAAFNAAQEGDIVEIEAGETFQESLRPPAKSGIVVRSSRWRELPPLNERIDPVRHAELMPTIRNISRNNTVMSFGTDENVVLQNQVILETSTLRFETSNGFTEGAAVACAGSQLPKPLARGVKYFLRNWNGSLRSAQLSTSPGGEAITLLDQGNAGNSNYFARPRCTAWDTPSNWTFRGIKFEALLNPGGSIGWLVNVGSNQQPSPNMGPNGIKFHQVVISGQKEFQDGPSFCLVLAAGSAHEVVSSWIDHCKAVGGIESKGIWLQNVNDVLIQNNYVSGASINILTAGGDAARQDVVRNVRILGNFLEKQGYMMYRQGIGAPSGECYYGGGSGAYYRRTDVSPNTCENGACYTCQADNTWALDTQTFYRSGNFLTKNMIELKDCDNCTIEGNTMRGSYIGPDAGQGACISITAGTGAGFGSGYHRNHNVTVRNNWCDQVYSGLTATNGSIGGGPFDQIPLKNISFVNNLVTNLGRFPALSQWGSTSDVFVRNFGVGQGLEGLRFLKNTFRPAPGSTARNAILFGPGAWPADSVVRNLDMRDNIFQFNGNGNVCALCIAFPPATAGSCSPGGFLRFVPDTTEKQIRNNLFTGGNLNTSQDFVKDAACTSRMFGPNEFIANLLDVGFVSQDNARISPSSPFSAENPSPTLLASDGSSLGADIDVLEMYTKPAELGMPPMPEQLALGIESGTTQALLRFRRPTEQACTVKLYSAEARIPANLNADTLDAGSQADDRASSIVQSGEVQFLLGAVSPLTPGSRYQYHVNCGELWAIGWLKTQSGAQEARADLVLEAASNGDTAVVEYSATPDFAAPQSLAPVSASGGKLVITLPTGSGARYVRYRILDGQGQSRKQSGVLVQPQQ